MPKALEYNRTLWLDTCSLIETSPLVSDIHTQVCVIGGGITGLTTAYLLLKEGKEVTVLESGALGSGQTGRTSAHLASAVDDHYFHLENIHGHDRARLVAQSHANAIDVIEHIVKKEKIDCDFERVDAYLFSESSAELDVLQKELEAARRCGFSDIDALESPPWPRLRLGAALRFANQAQFHPLRYISGLTRAIERLGGRIHTMTRAAEVHGGSHARVITEHGKKVLCDQIVVATNTPINERYAIHTKQAAYLTYVICVKIPKRSVPKALYWDLADPYHYMRIYEDKKSDFDILIVGGEDHKTGQSQEHKERYDRLERWLEHRFQGPKEVIYRWSGQVFEPVDGLAYIGHSPYDPQNVYLATGDSGNGLTHGTIAGMLLTDLIMGRETPLKDVYSPSRVRVKAAGEFLRENINVARQYAKWVTETHSDTLAYIAPGQGAVVEKDGVRIAIYRDSDGNIHERSAVCPHLKGIVNWNEDEKTWDCPCHGSRFDPYGNVILGPANRALDAVPEQMHERIAREDRIERNPPPALGSQPVNPQQPKDEGPLS